MNTVDATRSMTGGIREFSEKFRNVKPEAAETTRRVTYIGPAVTRWSQAYPALEGEVLEAVRAAVGSDRFYLDSAAQMVNSSAWYVLTGAMASAMEPGYRNLGINRTAIASVGHGPSLEENYRALGNQLATLPSLYRNYKVGGYGVTAPRTSQSARIVLAWGDFVNYVIRGLDAKPGGSFGGLTR